ncbi:MAG TPA: hypothetical protein VJC12_01550 [Candidatus Paceibacterota bacterium]
MSIETCRKCGKTFERNSQFGPTDSPICYSCTLNEFTGGRAPEEGDFNSASLTSGEISDKELKWLQEDLRAVEQGRSIREVPDEEEHLDWCDICGSTCYCYDTQEDSSNSDDTEVCSGCHLTVEDCECLSEDEYEAI